MHGCFRAFRASRFVLSFIAVSLLGSPLAAPSAALAAEPPRVVKVMPLGDSITEGWVVNPGGYRTKLSKLLATAGAHVDFVGSLSNGPSTLLDRNHEGHSGWKINEVNAQAGSWVRTYQPDVVLLHIGTNDLGQSYQLSQMSTRLGILLDTITSAKPDAHVIVASIVPHQSSYWRTYNSQVPGVVSAKAAAGKKVSHVDMASTLAMPADYEPDRTHPNLAGFNKMADAWLPAIMPVYHQVIGGTQPPTSSALKQINFGAQDSRSPAGYTLDYGQSFDLGRGYGWVDASSRPKSMVGYGRIRGAHADVRLDSLMHMQPAATSGSWEISLPPGSYEVTASVGDALYRDSRHVLDIEGRRAIDFTPATALFYATTTSVELTDGRLTLTPAGQNTKVNYVTIRQLAVAKPAVRIDAGGPGFKDASGKAWAPDGFAKGGGNSATSTIVAGTADSFLYQSERWGMAGYDIPVVNGNYKLRLHFAEINPASGRRVMNVYAEGRQLLSNFDISASAGGAHRALVREFDITVADSTANIAFQALSNSTSVSAIELLAL